MKQTIEHFKMVSGLEANSVKSQIFFGGIIQEEKSRFLQMLSFTEGSLLVRYLGVPLNSKRLTSSDCLPLILRVTEKIRSWTIKFLSYAGRCVLVKGVLQTISSFWCRVFILYNKVLHEINVLCRKFLWTGNQECSKKPLLPSLPC
eukprot:TRINITY_DN23707_c0_g1_i1.p1 TRINITY_DN23707_c0_g1~~TRINITY_DN23707_c0_g1_i1.p1  ORF type:complete len:146 (-),score=8.37 TRINITY_DN23707_c0_g1_i1:23-460(-)